MVDAFHLILKNISYWRSWRYSILASKIFEATPFIFSSLIDLESLFVFDKKQGWHLIGKSVIIILVINLTVVNLAVVIFLHWVVNVVNLIFNMIFKCLSLEYWSLSPLTFSSVPVTYQGSFYFCVDGWPSFIFLWFI